MKLTGRIATHGFEAVSEVHYAPGHHKTPRIWILIADNHLARIFRKPERHLELIAEAEPSETRGKEAIPNNAIGRVVSSSGKSVRHKLEPHMAPGEKEAQSFVHDIAAWLDEAVRENAFDRMILIAAPKMLGELRKALSGAIQNRIVAEVNKDLTKMPLGDLEEELEKIVWF